MAITYRDVIANPPANLAEWEETIINDHGLHTRWPKVLKRMYHAHNDKAARIQGQIAEMKNDPKRFTGHQLDGLPQLKEKLNKLRSIIKCCRVELEIRGVLKKEGRHPVEPTDDREGDKEIPVETKTITTIPARLKRSPVA